MWCMKCNKHLSECICEDLQERLDRIGKSGHVIISPENQAAYDAQAKRNKDERTIQE